MDCPKCFSPQESQLESGTCSSCGVIMAKYERMMKKKTLEEGERKKSEGADHEESRKTEEKQIVLDSFSFSFYGKKFSFFGKKKVFGPFKTDLFWDILEANWRKRGKIIFYQASVSDQWLDLRSFLYQSPREVPPDKRELFQDILPEVIPIPEDFDTNVRAFFEKGASQYGKNEKEFELEIETVIQRETSKRLRFLYDTVKDKIVALKRKREQIYSKDEFGFRTDNAEEKWTEFQWFFINRAFNSFNLVQGSFLDVFLRWFLDYAIDNIPIIENEGHPDNGHEFESWVVSQFTDHGIKAIKTKGSGDQGIDVLAEVNGVRWGIQCKRYSKNVANKAVQEVVAGLAFHGCSRAAVIASAGFTKSADQLALTNGVLLCGPDNFLQLIAEIEENIDSFHFIQSMFDYHEDVITQKWIELEAIYFSDAPVLNPYLFEKIRQDILFNEASLIDIQCSLGIPSHTIINVLKHYVFHDLLEFRPSFENDSILKTQYFSTAKYRNMQTSRFQYSGDLLTLQCHLFYDNQDENELYGVEEINYWVLPGLVAQKPFYMRIFFEDLDSIQKLFLCLTSKPVVVGSISNYMFMSEENGDLKKHPLATFNDVKFHGVLKHNGTPIFKIFDCWAFDVLVEYGSKEMPLEE